MRECSNCGASVREGAKFCTSCGTRLNDAAPETQLNSWALSDNDATVVAPAVAPPETEESTTTSEPEQETTPETAETDGFAWSWGTSTTTTSEESVGGDVETAALPVEEETTEAAPVEEPELDVVADDTNQSDEVAASPATDDQEPVVDPSPPEALESSDDGGDATLAAWAGQWSDEDAPLPSNDEPAEVEIERVDDATDDLTRAEQLLDELKRIIPNLSRPRGLEPGANAEGNTGLLAASAVLQDFDDSDGAESFDDLRDTIEAAQSNPRDVDSMLKLAANAERLRALLDDRDKLAGKITSLRDRLRAQASAETE